MIQLISAHPLVSLFTFAMFLIWLFALVHALTREDFDPVTRFMWVFLLVVLSLIGLILYWRMTVARSSYVKRFLRGPDVAEEQRH